MNPYIWCIVGAVVGFAASVVLPLSGKINRIESILVAVFGAFIGGEFVASLFSDGTTITPATADAAFRPASLLLAVAGAVVMLLLLAMMRRAVGPQQPHKVKRKRY